MSTGPWEEIEAVVAEAADLPPNERAALLDARCAGRPDVRGEVESLLASLDRAGTFLDVQPAVEDHAQAAAADKGVGQIVGRFRLLERIGEGGMGVVYGAERADADFTEQVAVKLLRDPIHHTETLRRFRVERQILATLNHPDIVTLLDAGVTDSGQAFLAMKYIAGTSIVRHCTEHRLSLDERIQLFQRVCAAVQHAHQNGVVYRDLKPANILVTSDGLPKVLDFGVAKLR